MSIMRKFLVLSGLILWASFAGAAQFQQHQYRVGEKFFYAFEDTEYNYQVSVNDKNERSMELSEIQEIRTDLKLSVIREKSGKTVRKMEIYNTQYKEGSTENYNQAEYRLLTTLIKNFPKVFSYTYEVEAAKNRVISDFAKFCAPYMNCSVGNFFYFKTLDIHTFESVIERMAGSLEPEKFRKIESSNPKISGGSFFNNSPAVTYNRTETMNGVPCAVFKYSTVGNRYVSEQFGVNLITDYGANIYVALEGKLAGMLIFGELHETVTGLNQGKPAYVVRMLTMRMRH
ncbi:MAG: hypothetical protein PHW04_03855 [Candidatus Wallbacteria bacterium]|nr:hypothetical protein [Candidatus Wallbacteria bacterium]